MKIKVLQAYHGDAILLSYKNGDKPRNILIDGGPMEAFETRLPRPRSGALKNAILELRRKGEKIDILILTHIDDDHINGLLKWFEWNDFTSDMIGKVLFNSSRLIAEHFKQEEIKENLIDLHIYDSSQTSIKQGVKFEDFLENHDIWHRQIIKTGVSIEELEVKLQIISPTEEKLKKLLIKWEKEVPDTHTAAPKNDYKETIDEILLNDEFKEDQAVHNGSSIAFILTYKNKNLVFLGDAHPQPVIDTLHSFGYSKDNPLKAEYLKLSHHGSKYNTNPELLELIDCDNFIISTNGNRHALPNKRCLARIIKNKQRPKFFFNYPYLIKNIFHEDELASGLFEALPAGSELSLDL